MAKRKTTKGQIMICKTLYTETKDRATRGDLRCSGRL